MKISWRFAFPLILIFCGLLARGVYYFQLQDNPFFDHVPPATDQAAYHDGGKAFAEGDPLAVAPGQHNKFSPLYQYFLGFLYKLFGIDLRVVWIAQFCLGIGSSLLVYFIGLAYFTPTAALTAGLLFTLYPVGWMYEGSLFREPLMTFLELLAFVTVLKFARNRNTGWLLGSAVALGLFAQSRTNNFLLVPIAIYFLWKNVFSVEAEGKKRLAVYLMVFVLTCLPLLGWVKVVHGKWGFYDQDGPETFLFANMLDYSGREFGFTPQYVETLKTVPLETGAAVRHVIGLALSHPVDFSLLYLRKAYYFFNNYEVPNMFNFYLAREFAPVLGLGIPFGLLAALGLAGFFLVYRDTRRWTMIHAFALGNFLMFWPFFVTSRFRLLGVPFLALLSGYTIAAGIRMIRENNRQRLGALALALCILGGLTWSRPLPEGNIRIIDLINLGSTYLNNGKSEDDVKSYGYYLRAWNLSASLPRDRRKNVFLNRAFLDYYRFEAGEAAKRGNRQKEEVALRHALYFNQASAELHQRYSQTLFRNDKIREAFIEGLQALDLDRSRADTHLILADINLRSLNRPLWALFHYQEAERLLEDPARGKVTEQIGRLVREIEGRNLASPGQVENLEATRKFLHGQLARPVPFEADVNLPPPLAELPRPDAENYLMHLYHLLLCGPEENLAILYFQMAVLYREKLENPSAAAHYFTRAWNEGMRPDGLKAEIDRLEDHLTTAPLPWESKGPNPRPVPG